ncbi:putative FAD-binding PCMH-type domain-containing protein [Seiridium cardinale]|uniref:FAD-binding PCMH-type domain-containing protein n=1 Tax=Seiridium cardinale TaxID=138064 RepID=A0ABR2XMS1_9PEZI
MKITTFSLQSLLITPGYGARRALQQVFQATGHAAGIDTVGFGYASPEFSSTGMNGAAPFDEDCFVSTEASELLEVHGNTLRDCNSVATIADLYHAVCLEDSGCPHPFLTDQERQNQPGLQQRTGAARACMLASFLLGPNDDVIGSEDVEYRKYIQVNWSKDCWLEARCVIRPSSAAAVQMVMKIISRTSSRFAIRSGGHNPNRGSGSIDGDGILVDLSLLNHMHISHDALTVRIGPGLRWIDVYKKLDGTGRTVLGGRTPDVGVGGLLLGGGIPNFSSEFGLACDLVRSYEVVTANGSLVKADRESNEDLWWALKGGGSNFGIVTEFELETVPIKEICESRALINATREYQVAAESDLRASFAFSLSNNHTIVAFIYSSPVENPATFSMFYDIPYLRHFIAPSFGTPYTLAAAFEQVLGDRPSFKRDIIAVSTKPDLSLYEYGYSNWLNLSQEMMSKFDCMMTFGLQPVTSNAVLNGNARGGNPMNITPQSQHWYTSVIQWQDDNFDDLAHEAIVRSGGAVREFAEKNGLLLDFEFLNDASWHQDPIASYGHTNVERLRQISRKYDPSRVFQELQNNGFRLDGKL